MSDPTPAFLRWVRSAPVGDVRRALAEAEKIIIPRMVSEYLPGDLVLRHSDIGEEVAVVRSASGIRVGLVVRARGRGTVAGWVLSCPTLVRRLACDHPVRQ